MLWIVNIEFIYFTALNIANAALLGGALLLLFEFMEKSDYTFEQPPIIETVIALASFVILEGLLIYFYFFTAQGLTGNQKLIFSIVNIIGFLLSVGILIFRYLFKLGDTEEGTSLFGWVTIFAFQLVNIASSEETLGDLALFSRTTAILITCGIFLILFISSYREAARYV